MSNKAQQTNLNIRELKAFMGHIVANNRYLQERGKTPVAVNLVGESGIGKTSAVLQLAKEMQMNYVKLNLAQIEELGDLVGFPVRQFQLCKAGSAKSVQKTQTSKVKKTVEQTVTVMEMQEVEDFEVRTEKKPVLVGGKMVMKDIEVRVPVKVQREVPVEKIMPVEVEEDVIQTVEATDAGECLWIDEQAVEEYTKRGYAFTGEKRMSYCPPEWIANKTGGGFLLLDDFNRADVRLLQAAMEICDRQEYISWKLPKDWHVILTSNPDDGTYLVNSMDVAQQTRFLNINLKSDVEVWAEWAEINGIDSRCINFLLLHPEMITTRTNPRSITTFFNSISSIQDFAKDLPMIQMIGEGSVGGEFTTAFNLFINNRLDKLISPHVILTHDDHDYVLKEMSKTIGKDGDYRADIASVLTTRIINYSLVYAENNSITQKIIDRIINLVVAEEVLTDDLKYVLVKRIHNGNKAKFQKILANKTVTEISLK